MFIDAHTNQYFCWGNIFSCPRFVEAIALQPPKSQAVVPKVRLVWGWCRKLSTNWISFPWKALDLTIDEAIWKLDRAQDCFQKILEDPQLEFQLPKKHSVTGVILKHAIETIEKKLSKYGPMVYKIGFTSDPQSRFRNPKWGYAHDPYQKWECMVLLHASYESIGPSFLESCLIEKYKGSLDEFGLPLDVHEVL